MSELWKYKYNIIRPKRSKYVSKYTGRTDLSLGTYIKPLARLVAWMYKKQGYKTKLRGRGERASKYHNINNDIRIQDSVFCAVYAYKEKKCQTR